MIRSNDMDRTKDIVWALRHWVGIWRGHHGRLAPEVDFDTLAEAADELERLRAQLTEARAKCEEVARDGFDSMGLRAVETVLSR